MYKYTIALLLMLACVPTLSHAQQREVDEADTSRFRFHFSTGTSIAFAHGKAEPSLWVAPQFGYIASDRLTLRGGFAIVGSPNEAYRIGSPRSLAPRRHTTNLTAVNLEADWRISASTTLWAAVYHSSGWMQPWFDPTGEAFPLGLTAFSAGLDCEVSDNAMLSVYVSFVRDHYGTAPLGYETLYAPYSPWGCFGGRAAGFADRLMPYGLGYDLWRDF